MSEWLLYLGEVIHESSRERAKRLHGWLYSKFELSPFVEFLFLSLLTGAIRHPLRLGTHQPFLEVLTQRNYPGVSNGAFDVALITLSLASGILCLLGLRRALHRQRRTFSWKKPPVALLGWGTAIGMLLQMALIAVVVVKTGRGDIGNIIDPTFMWVVTYACLLADNSPRKRRRIRKPKPILQSMQERLAGIHPRPA